MSEVITELKIAVVEEIVFSGSAFAVTKDGDGIFINSRIVDKLGLKPGDSIQAYIVPNYPDKADQIKYRAMRASLVSQVNPVEEGLHKIAGNGSLPSRITRLLKEDEALWTLSEICEELAESEQDVYTALATLPNVQSTKAYYIL
tara:strand:+ start:408 stop:842 length:435 start_codon:yes stop_codon:yes gene_type:complete